MLSQRPYLPTFIFVIAFDVWLGLVLWKSKSEPSV